MTLAIATHSIKDRPSTWGSDLTPAPFFDIEAYQKQLDRIAGLTQQGEPVLRLVWGGGEWVERAVDFDAFGNPTEWARVPRHAFVSKNPDKWGQRIPLRRWVIEENTDAGQLEAMGGKNHGNEIAKERGYYTPYIIIADHSKCRNCDAANFKCFGDYKQPGYEELSFLTEATYKLLSKKQDHREAVDMELVKQIVASEAPDKGEIKAHDEEENRRFTKEWLATHKPLRFDIGRNNNANNDSTV
jgi:hypothetical protein